MVRSGGFRHHTPAQRVFAGDECLGELAGEVRRLGCRRAIVFCGRSVARDGGGLGRVRDALGTLCAGVFDGVRAHSPLPAVLAGVEALRATEADVVVTLGGGSAIVTGRAAAILLAEGRPVEEICTRFAPDGPPVSPKLARPKLPQIAIPTTATTACAKAGSAVLDPERGRRLALFDPKTRARAVFFDPDLAAAAPPTLFLDAALNGLAMALQALEAPNREPLADALLLHAVRLLADNLPALADNLPALAESAEARQALMLGSLLAGQGSDFTAGGLASVLSYGIGARFGLPNGVTNAVLLPHTLRFDAPAIGDRLRLPAALLRGREGAADPSCGTEEAAARCEALFRVLSVPRRLRDLGVAESDLPLVAADATQDWFLRGVPRRPSEAELVDLLCRAW